MERDDVPVPPGLRKTVSGSTVAGGHVDKSAVHIFRSGTLEKTLHGIGLIGCNRRISRVFRPAVDEDNRTLQHLHLFQNILVILPESGNDQGGIAELLCKMIQMGFENFLRSAAQKKHQTVPLFGKQTVCLGRRFNFNTAVQSIHQKGDSMCPSVREIAGVEIRNVSVLPGNLPDAFPCAFPDSGIVAKSTRHSRGIQIGQFCDVVNRDTHKKCGAGFRLPAPPRFIF